ncbi:MAG: acyltransferase [Nitrospira sp.]|nr:acyltransferase [Nitrospira sp.]
MFPKNNNLEWLRLIFAIQVVLAHAADHMELALPKVIRHFPGVPAFFFVSGFLIYASYLNAPGRRYLENRFLRLFPGLMFVTIGGGVVVLIAHGWTDLLDNITTYAIWFLAQITLGQAYSPGLFRDVGVGVINGSLWTITTEIVFYLSVPIIVWLEQRFRFTIVVIFVLSFTIYSIGPLVFSATIYRDKTFYDVLALTPIAWGWMFATGIFAVQHFAHLQRWLPYMPWVIVPVVAMIFFGQGVLFGSSGNRLGLIYFSCYIGMVLWFAFVAPFVRVNFDLSYGAYVWHMPIINLLLVLGVPSVLLAVVLTFFSATLSWFLVERPALKLKQQSLKAILT